MSNGDFEVMPRGTIEEVQAMRQFANDMIQLSNKYELPKEILAKIRLIDAFYTAHVQKYPVTV